MKCNDWKHIVLEPMPGVTIPDMIHCGEEATEQVRDLHLCSAHAEHRKAQFEAEKRANGRPKMVKVGRYVHPWPEPAQDESVDVGLVLVVHGFGHREQVTLGIVRTLCMLLHRAFDDQGTHVTEQSPGWELRLEDGRRVVYDHLADDGEHINHSEILYIEPAK